MINYLKVVVYAYVGVAGQVVSNLNQYFNKLYMVN